MGEVKIFLISGGKKLSCEGEGYFFRGGQFILRSFSHFEMQDFKGSKIFACGAFIFNIHIFRFRMHARLQVDIDFNIESKFSFSRSGFFSPLGGHSKVTKPVKLLFYPIGAFRGPRNHPVSIARSFCVNMDKHAAISQN